MEEEKEFGHLMIDLETMDTASTAAIISIGAVEFDIETGETGKKFYVNVELQSCLDMGMTVSGDTIMWWMKQCDEARDTLQEKDPIMIQAALMELNMFMSERGKSYQIWSRPASFDLVILANAYRILDYVIPWNFRNERCVRTLQSMRPEINIDVLRTGTHHNAIDDAIHQADYCSRIWKALNPETRQVKSSACVKCSDFGWLYDAMGNRTGLCECHY